MAELFSHICQFCCTVNTTDTLSTIQDFSDQFLQTFFNSDSEDNKNALVVCNACRLKLDSFKLFWLQYRANGNLLRVLRQRHPQGSGVSGDSGDSMKDTLMED